MSWLTRLLPLVEQDGLWQEALAAYDKDKWFKSPPHLPILGHVVPLFSCPADSRTLDPWTLKQSTVVAFTGYQGLEGTDQFQRDGILFLDSQVRFADIRDGASNTLMIGERPPSADYVLGWWYAGWGQNKDGSAEYVLGVNEMNTYAGTQGVCPSGPYSFAPGSISDICDTFHFWSLHSGGANFAFADGSVHFLTYSVAPLMPSLASRARGEIVTVPD
jgi:prepilin-type processing-associated H-X9-DG protein